MSLPQTYKPPKMSTLPQYILGIAFLLSCVALQGQQIESDIDTRLACKALEHALDIRPAITAAFLSEPIPFSRLNKHLEAMRLMLNSDLPENLIHAKSNLRALDLANSAFRQRQPTVIKVHNSLRDLIKLSPSLTNQANSIAAREAATSASPLRISVARRLGLLSEDFSKHAMGLAAEGISPESLFELGKGLNWFETLLRGLIEGSDELKIIATNDTQQKARLQKLSEDYYLLRGHAGQALSNLQDMVSAREELKGIRTIAGNLVADFDSACHQK
jgi:hypothetical protein